MQGPIDPSQLDKLLEVDGKPDPKDETIASLERDLQSITNKLYEERFVWIMICIVLIDIYVFSHMDNWSAPLVIGVLELVGIVIIADRCQVNTVMPLIDRLAGLIPKVGRDRD